MVGGLYDDAVESVGDLGLSDPGFSGCCVVPRIGSSLGFAKPIVPVSKDKF